MTRKISWTLFALVMMAMGWVWTAVTVTDWYKRYDTIRPTGFVDPVDDPQGLLPVATGNDPLLKISDDDDIGRKPGR